MKAQYLYGINPILAALSANRRKLYSLFLTEPCGDKYRILSKANELNLKIESVSKEFIEKYARNKPHQGVLLKASEISPVLIEEPSGLYPETSPQLWICLDQINDPQNLGSILRAAHFFKANGVILTTKGSAPLSPAVAKVSSGALEWTQVFEVADLPLFLSKAKKEDWKVIGSGIGKDIKHISRHKKMLAVFGNEGEGIRERVKKECEEMYWVPGGNEEVDSLNVAAAISVFLDRLR